MLDRNAMSAWKSRTTRLDLVHLEDRIVPGEMFGTSMLWAMGAFVDPAGLLSNQARLDSTVPSALSSSIAGATEKIALVESGTTALAAEVERSAEAVQSETTVTADAPTPTDTTGANDQAFADFGSTDGNFSPPIEATGKMGDLPRASAPASNGATAAPAARADFLAPPVSGGVGQGSVNNLGATLATLANYSPTASASATATSAANPTQTVAVDGVATPLYHARAVAAPNANRPAASGGAAPFSPAQLQQAYGFNLISNKGSGQTIYIVDAYNDPNIASDLKTFDAQFGLSNPTLTVHKMSSRIRNSTSWGVEESLDVEWSHAIAPQANIVLVEATSASNSALNAAVDWATNNGAHIVSMSYGGTDYSGESSMDSHFNHTGVSYIASAGDSGGVVEYPSASPYVLSVGGTSLTLDANNNYVSESAWSSGGGGASVGESLPTYQSNYGISLSGRGTPDVSYDADPNTGVYVYDSYINGGGGWYEVGGTSAGAPQWAALIALVNQSRSTPLSTNNLTSRTEYNAATGSVYGSNYHDVTTGSNGYSATVGYDLATGVGSPQANNLIPWLTSNS